MEPNTLLAIAAIAVVLGVIACLALILNILWKVYEHGGSGDVSAFAKALREVYDPSWAAKAFRSIKGVQTEKDDERS